MLILLISIEENNLKVAYILCTFATTLFVRINAGEFLENQVPKII